MTVLIYSLLILFMLLILMKTEYNNGFFYILSVFLVVMAGFRYGVGTDFLAYKNSFETGVYWYEEWGFVTLVELLTAVGLNAQGVFLVIAILIQVIMFRGLRKLSNNYTVFLFSIFFYISLYYFNESLNIIRQFLAMAIFIWNFDNVIKRNVFKFSIFIFISYLFHASVLYFVPLYFLYPILKKLMERKLIVYCLIAASYILMHINFDNVIESFLLSFNNNSGDVNSYGVYLDYYFDDYVKYELSFNLWTVLTVKMLISLYIIYNSKKYMDNLDFKNLYSVYIFGVMLVLTFSPMLIFRRLIYYVSIFEILVFAIFAVKDSTFRVLIIIFALFYFGVNLLFGFSTPMPYRINLDIFG
ncbi:MAG: EpsG family protein [Solibacillus sp.]